MTKNEDFKLLKIQTCILKVNIHCEGCEQKVKKLLHKIEGVYTVSIDAEQQKVTVSGTVNSADLIKKLVRAGKHSEIWSQKSNNQNQKQNASSLKDDKNSKGQKQGQTKGTPVFKSQKKFPAFNSEEDREFIDDEDSEDELRLVEDRMYQLGLLGQQPMSGNNANRGKMMNNGGDGNGGKKGNPNVNAGMKTTSGAIDPRMMAALKLNNAHFGANGNGNHGENRRGSDINTMMGLAGFHGNGSSATSLRANSNGLGGFQLQPSNGFQGALSQHHGQHSSPATLMNSMNGYNHYTNSNHPSSMMMMNNMNRVAMQQQPQMMYQRSSLIPPNTIGYNYTPSLYPYPYSSPNYSGDTQSATVMFNDENSNSCSVM